MKNLKNLILLAVIVLLAINCKKNDPVPSIVGTWLQTGYTNSLCDVSSDNGSYSCGGSSSSCITAQLKSDGTTVWSYPGGSISGTYSMNGSTITITLAPSSSSQSYPFTLTSSTLTISGFSNSVRLNGSAPDGVDNCTMALVFARQ